MTGPGVSRSLGRPRIAKPSYTRSRDARLIPWYCRLRCGEEEQVATTSGTLPAVPAELTCEYGQSAKKWLEELAACYFDPSHEVSLTLDDDDAAFLDLSFRQRRDAGIAQVL